jgi:hypothetical protein
MHVRQSCVQQMQDVCATAEIPLHPGNRQLNVATVLADGRLPARTSLDLGLQAAVGSHVDDRKPRTSCQPDCLHFCSLVKLA